MRLSLKQNDKAIDIFFGETHLVTVSHHFVKSEIGSWDISSKEEFFPRFCQLERQIAIQLAFIKLSRKAMHSEEVRCHLQEHYFTDGAIEQAILECQRLGALNDVDFVAHFVKKMQKRGKSSRQIVAKFRQKGVACSELSSYLQTDDETLRELIEKRYPQLLQKNTPFIQKQKAMSALFRRGFSSSTISCILKDIYV